MPRPRSPNADQLSFVFADTGAPAALVCAPAATREAPPPPRKRVTRKIIRPQTRLIDRDDRRLTVEETAQLLGVSVKTLEAWRRLGKGPAFVKLGRSVRYTMRALDQFTSDRTVRNSAEGRSLDARR